MKKQQSIQMKVCWAFLKIYIYQDIHFKSEKINLIALLRLRQI